MRHLAYTIAAIILSFSSISSQHAISLKDHLPKDRLIYDSIRWNKSISRIQGYSEGEWKYLYHNGDDRTFNGNVITEMAPTIGAEPIMIEHSKVVEFIECTGTNCIFSTEEGKVYFIELISDNWKIQDSLVIINDEERRIKGLSISNERAAVIDDTNNQILLYQKRNENWLVDTSFTHFRADWGQKAENFTIYDEYFFYSIEIMNESYKYQDALVTYSMKNNHWIAMDTIIIPNPEKIRSIKLIDEKLIITDIRKDFYVYVNRKGQWHLKQSIDLGLDDRELLLTSDFTEEKIFIGASNHDTIVTKGGALFIYSMINESIALDTVIAPAELEWNENFGLKLRAKNDWIASHSKSDQLENQAGALYLYNYRNNHWNIEAKIIPSELQANSGLTYNSILFETGIISHFEGSLYYTSLERIDSIGQIRFDSTYLNYQLYDGYKWMDLNPHLYSSQTDSTNLSRINLIPPLAEQELSSMIIKDSLLYIGLSEDTINGKYSGAVFIYKENSRDNWTLQQEIRPEDGEEFDRFGIQIEVSKDHLLVAASGDRSPPNKKESIYVYKRESDKWSYQNKIVPDSIRFAPKSYYSEFELIDQHIAFGPSDLSLYRIDNDRSEITKLNTPEYFPGSYYDLSAKTITTLEMGRKRLFIRTLKREGEQWVEQGETSISNSDGLSCMDMINNQLIIASTSIDTSCPNCGGINIYEKNHDKWIKVQELAPENLTTNSKFGHFMAAGEGGLIVSDRNNNYLYIRNGNGLWELKDVFYGMHERIYDVRFAISEDKVIMKKSSKNQNKFIELWSYHYE